MGRLPGRRRLASARASRAPLLRPDHRRGVPYWQIALLHLDSVASTVLQTCAYWGNDDQCTFCGIGVTLANGRTIARKTPGCWPKSPSPLATSTAQWTRR